MEHWHLEELIYYDIEVDDLVDWVESLRLNLG